MFIVPHESGLEGLQSKVHLRVMSYVAIMLSALCGLILVQPSDSQLGGQHWHKQAALIVLLCLFVALLA